LCSGFFYFQFFVGKTWCEKNFIKLSRYSLPIKKHLWCRKFGSLEKRDLTEILSSQPPTTLLSSGSSPSVKTKTRKITEVGLITYYPHRLWEEHIFWRWKIVFYAWRNNYLHPLRITCGFLFTVYSRFKFVDRSRPGT